MQLTASAEAVLSRLDIFQRAVADIVYTDLLQEKQLVNLYPNFINNANIFYWSAQNAEGQPVAYVPLQHSKDIDLQQLHALQQELKGSSIFIALADNTGNILYYAVKQGIVDK
ncbi:uncharacterized protein LOC108596272 [Drosophila busckii]|uniref:uncharacterized protein LOC108596272 n=1 Tax=Drosophila busckii TaxID=30019 RepID=UPI00083F0EA6|nr:uncharacterized protein LOC108596272 [Drosophila busckii]